MAQSLSNTTTRALLLTCAVWIAALSIGSTQSWQYVELKLFDRLSVMTSPGKSVLPITIVGIDEASLSQINRRWPWPRDVFAQVIDHLSAAGAAVIAVDVLFNESSDPAQDSALAAAIARAGNVVLSADHTYHETALFRQWLRVDPIPVLTQAGAVTGLATVTLDGDAFVRRLPMAEDAFWRRTIEVLLRARPGIVGEPQVSGELFIRHLGPAHTFPYISFYQVLNAEASIPADMFRDQIVLIGRDVRASAEIGSAQADLFATPFVETSHQLTPGVEILATLLENVLTGQAITHAGNRWALLVTTAALLLAFPALVRWRPVWSGIWIIALAGLVAAGTVWLFAKQHYWLPAGSSIAALGTLYVAMGILSYVSELRRVERIKNAFGKYVSPQVVKQMISRPELLKLGGERCDLTVLFADLAGFTAISEKLAPENVAKVVNIYLTGMTEVILAEGGTVDKFIGDAVMAFWGAPLPDPDHALHAVRSAIGMQAAMHRLQPRFAELGCGAMAVRIGINSGPVVVGNMGSEDRFDYTVMGDSVNLASRLEAVNKIYGTGILLSENTARLLPAEPGLRTIDIVRVQGKREAVTVFTPCEDAELVRRSGAALKTYWARDWIESQQAWTQVIQHAPGDPVAEVFLKRIKALVADPPPANWDGAVDLQKS